MLSARHSQLAPKDAELAVKTMLDAMALTLASGNRIEIRGLGSFGLNFRPPRVGRNPKTGERVQVPRKYVPHFKAGKELRERVMATTSTQRLLIDLPVYRAITGTRQRESEMLFKDGIA